MEAYTHLQEISTAVALKHYPRTSATAAELADGDETEVRVQMTQAKACVAPAVQYFKRKFNKHGTPMPEEVQLFKAVRVLCPQQAREHGVDINHWLAHSSST